MHPKWSVLFTGTPPQETQQPVCRPGCWYAAGPQLSSPPAPYLAGMPMPAANAVLPRTCSPMTMHASKISPSTATTPQLGVTDILFSRLQLIHVLATGSTTTRYA